MKARWRRDGHQAGVGQGEAARVFLSPSQQAATVSCITVAATLRQETTKLPRCRAQPRPWLLAAERERASAAMGPAQREGEADSLQTAKRSCNSAAERRSRAQPAVQAAAGP